MLLTCYYLIFKEKNVPKKNDRIFLVLHRNEIYNSRAVTQCLAFPQLRDRTELSLWPVSHRCVLETPLERWIVLLSLVRTIQIMSPYVEVILQLFWWHHSIVEWLLVSCLSGRKTRELFWWYLALIEGSWRWHG